jgi:hypothetical protein
MLGVLRYFTSNRILEGSVQYIFRVTLRWSLLVFPNMLVLSVTDKRSFYLDSVGTDILSPS